MKPFLAVSILALGVLGGCADGVSTVTHDYPYPPSTASGYLRDAGAAGPVLLEVRDSPFPGDVAAPLADAASRTSVGFLTRFTTVRSEAAKPDYRMVVQFDPDVGTTSAGVCDPAQPAGHRSSTGRLSALVAFCHQSRPILSVMAAGPRPDRPDSPILRDLAQQAMLRMFIREPGGSDSPQGNDNPARRLVR